MQLMVAASSILAKVVVNHGLFQGLPGAPVNSRHNLSILQTQPNGPRRGEVFRKVDVSVRFQEASVIPETGQVRRRLLDLQPARQDLALKAAGQGNHPSNCASRLKNLGKRQLRRPHEP